MSTSVATSEATGTELVMPSPRRVTDISIACLNRNFVVDVDEKSEAADEKLLVVQETKASVQVDAKEAKAATVNVAKGKTASGTWYINEPYCVMERQVFTLQDIEIGPQGSITIEPGSMLILRDTTLKGVNNQSLIFGDATSVLVLDSTDVEFNWYCYQFKCGIIKISRDCFFLGTPWFSCFPCVIDWNVKHAAFVSDGRATLELEDLVVEKVASRSYIGTIKHAFTDKDFVMGLDALVQVPEQNTCCIASEKEADPLVVPVKKETAGLHKKAF